MEDGCLEEFDNDNSSPLRDLSASTSPSCQFTYNDTDIDHISDYLAIPWDDLKTVPFGSVIPYLGLNWDLDAKVVTLPDPKKHKYLACIEEWCQHQTHTLAQVQSLYGKLLHSCLVVKEG